MHLSFWMFVKKVTTIGYTQNNEMPENYTHRQKSLAPLNIISRGLPVFVILFLTLNPKSASAQLQQFQSELKDRLRAGGSLPEKLLSSRSIVLYPYSMTEKELTEIQTSFQRTGIDAVAYFEVDRLTAGKDMSRALTFYFNKRSIVNLIFFGRTESTYEVFITGYNTKDTFVEGNQLAWHAEDKVLSDLLKQIYRSAAGGLERKNFLISDFPETHLPINPIAGRRAEFFAIDLKVDQLAVPKFGIESADQDLELLFAGYPYKFKLTEPGLTERELRSQGFLYILSFVHVRASVAREILGYDTSKPESAYVSITYTNGQPQLKNISANTPVYKFYFKHIESGNVFLGTRWDADTTWQQALKNHLTAFKAELKIN